MTWMAWTQPTAVFFICIGVGLVTMTILELVNPTTTRRGFLPLATTRGDRFFISLLVTAFVHIAWLLVTLLPVWYASVIALGMAFVVMRWG